MLQIMKEFSNIKINARLFSQSKHIYVVAAAGFSIDDDGPNRYFFTGLKIVRSLGGQVI